MSHQDHGRNSADLLLRLDIWTGRLFPVLERPSMGAPVSVLAPDEAALRLPPHGGVLVFDGCCGFCTRAVQFLLRRDRAHRVRALPFQAPRVLALAGLGREAAMQEAYWIGADGVRRRGAGAMAAALSASTGLPSLLLYRLPVVRWAADRVYRWVADHRRLLRGVAPHCAASASCDCDAGGGCSTPDVLLHAGSGPTEAPDRGRRDHFENRPDERAAQRHGR